jgi:hypothetical protein
MDDIDKGGGLHADAEGFFTPGPAELQRRANTVATPRLPRRGAVIPVRIQSSHSFAERGLDPYFTPVEATLSLLALEGERLPRRLWEPACGDGAIVHPLRESGRLVYASDICDYGLSGAAIVDYFDAEPPVDVEGIVTNPPFALAQQFAEKALRETRYVALLVRSNFVIEGSKRGRWLDANPPTRQWWSAQRFPMMHRQGWTGPRASSNTPYCWIIWERGAAREHPTRFYWRRLLRPRHPVLLSGAAHDTAVTRALRASLEFGPLR